AMTLCTKRGWWLVGCECTMLDRVELQHHGLIAETYHREVAASLLDQVGALDPLVEPARNLLEAVRDRPYRQEQKLTEGVGDLREVEAKRHRHTSARAGYSCLVSVSWSRVWEASRSLLVPPVERMIRRRTTGCNSPLSGRSRTG